MSSELFSLLESSSSQFVDQVFLRVYQTRLDGINASLVESVSNQLEIDTKKGRQLLESIFELEKQVVYHNVDEKEKVFYLKLNQILKLLGSMKMKEGAKAIICDILLKYVPIWRDQTIQTQVSFSILTKRFLLQN
jgi:RNA binding exosome subunit